MNDVISIKRLEALISSMAGYSAEDYQETMEAVQRGLERARVALVKGGAISAVFAAGRVDGIRAEREKRRKHRV